MSTAFAHLSKAQVLGLVLWSAGIALTESLGISQISALLAQVLEQKEGTVFQRLREWYLDAPHKRGDQRRERRGSAVVSAPCCAGSCSAGQVRRDDWPWPWMPVRWWTAGRYFREVGWCAAVPYR